MCCPFFPVHRSPSPSTVTSWIWCSSLSHSSGEQLSSLLSIHLLQTTRVLVLKWQQSPSMSVCVMQCEPQRLIYNAALLCLGTSYYYEEALQLTGSCWSSVSTHRQLPPSYFIHLCHALTSTGAYLRHLCGPPSKQEKRSSTKKKSVLKYEHVLI